MMPSNDLLERLTELGDHLDDERSLRRAPLAAIPGGERPRVRSRRGAPLAVAAALVVLAGLAVGVLAGRDGDGDRGITVRAASGAAGEVVGLHPLGDVQAVLDAGFDEPAAAVASYLEDRVANAPEGVVLAADVGTTGMIGDDRAVVSFSLVGADDTGDGYVLVQRVGPVPGAWAVLASSIISLDVPSISYVDGSVTGELSTEIGGSTFVEVRDAASGELLASDEIVQPSGDGGTSRFAFDGIVAPAVAVRFWNVGDLERQAGPRATFAEVRLYDGDRDVDAGWQPMADTAATVTEVEATLPDPPTTIGRTGP